MSTYRNAFRLLGEVRRGLDEYSANYVNGTDTSGNFDNANILEKINDSQKFLWDLLFKRFPEYFLDSVDLTASSSVLTLPSYVYGRFLRLENSNGRKIEPATVNQRHLSSYAGSPYAYYRYGNNLRIDKEGVNDVFKLWFFKQPRELTCGRSAAGGAGSLTLASEASGLTDYYNGMVIENETDAWVDTITDYTAARVCTITQTGAASKDYGLVSELPEPFHRLIGGKALLLMKDDPKSPEKPTKTEISQYAERLVEALRSFTGTQNSDQTMESIFLDFDPYL